MSSKTFRCFQILPHPIKLDTQNYDYALKILTVQFSNVIPNVEEAMYVESSLVADVGIYELSTLIDSYNTYTYGKLSINNNNGKMYLLNDTGSTLTINSSNFLTSSLCGKYTLPIVLAPGDHIESPQTPAIQAYNYFILTSSNVNGYTQTSKNGGTFTPNNTLWPFSSAMAPFKFKTWTSLQPVEFKLDNDIVNYIEFELKTADGLPLDNQLADSDFMITAQIVQYKKMTQNNYL